MLRLGKTGSCVQVCICRHQGAEIWPQRTDCELPKGLRSPASRFPNTAQRSRGRWGQMGSGPGTAGLVAGAGQWLRPWEGWELSGSLTALAWGLTACPQAVEPPPSTGVSPGVDVPAAWAFHCPKLGTEITPFPYKVCKLRCFTTAIQNGLKPTQNLWNSLK